METWCTMFVSPKFVCWNPNVQCDGIRRWGLWEGGEVMRVESLWMGLVPLRKRPLSSSHHVRLHWKDGQLGSETSPKTKSSSIMTLDFPDSRSMRNELLFTSYLSMVFSIAAWMHKDTCCTVFHGMNELSFIISSSVDRHLGCFQLGTTINSDVMFYTLVHGFWCTHVHISIGLPKYGYAR